MITMYAVHNGIRAAHDGANPTHNGHVDRNGTDVVGNDDDRFRLSIVVPVFNEEATVGRVLRDLEENSSVADAEMILVDDGSTDATFAILSSISDGSGCNAIVVHHDANLGKGAAIRTAINFASGSHLLVFDADSEYDAADIPRLVEPILRGRAEVVYGVRLRGSGTSFPFFLNAIGNRMMTAVANALFGSAISDLHTCLKLLPVPMLRQMHLTENGFGLDTEISAELLRLGFRPYEVPVTYVGRSVQDGKKIRLADAWRCLLLLLKIRARGRVVYGARDRSLAPRVTSDIAFNRSNQTRAARGRRSLDVRKALGLPSINAQS
jgi:dolichol-phosphate hexosyltransferase